MNVNNRNGRILSLAVFALAMLLSNLAMAQQPTAPEAIGNAIDAREAINRILSDQTFVQNATWNVDVTQGEITNDPVNPEIVRVRPYSFNGRTLLDFSKGRFRASVSMVSPEGGSPQAPDDSLTKIDEAASYDLNVYRWWNKTATFERAVGPDVPKYGTGIIDINGDRLNDAEFMKSKSCLLGVWWMPPNFCVNPRSTDGYRNLDSHLRNLLENLVDVSAVESSGNLVVSVTRSFNPELFPVTMDLYWSIESKAIVRQVWYYKIDNKREMLSEVRIWLQDVGGQSMPQQVVSVDYSGANNIALRWVFSDIVINRTISDDDFRIHFPENIKLADYIGRKKYMTSSGPVSEKEAAARFASEIGLDGAGLAVDGSEENSRTPVLFWILVINGVAVLFIFLGVVGRKVFAKSFFVVGCFIFWTSSAELLSPAVADDFPLASRTLVSYSPKESVFVSKCGARACYFSFEYFGVDYSPSVVNESLPDFGGGVSVADVSRVLKAYGMRVDLRRNATLSEVKNAVKVGRLAIVPVSVDEEWNHFYVVCRRQDGVVCVVDSPNFCHPLEKALPADALSPTGGVVIFVEAGSRESPRPKVSLEPSGIVFGSPVGEGSSVVDALTISNIGVVPFVIEEFVAECGCVKVKGSKGLVAPGQSKTIIVEVVATAWDNKSSVKSVEVKIPRAVDPIRFSVRSISQPKATENRR